MLEEKQKNWGVGAIGAINEAGPGLFRLHLQIGQILLSNLSLDTFGLNKTKIRPICLLITRGVLISKSVVK